MSRTDKNATKLSANVMNGNFMTSNGGHTRGASAFGFSGSVLGFQVVVGHLAGKEPDHLVCKGEGDQGRTVLPLAHEGLGRRGYELVGELLLAETALHARSGEIHGPESEKSDAFDFPPGRDDGQMNLLTEGSARSGTSRASQDMGMDKQQPSRRPLTAEERSEAARLKAAWMAFKREHKVTQEWLGKTTDLGSQAAVTQYLNARIPLNLTALLRICDAIGAVPGEISPRLAPDIERARGNVIAGMGLSGALAQLRGESAAAREPGPGYAFSLPATTRITLLPALVPQPGAAPYHVCIDDLGPAVVQRASSLAYLRMPEGDTAMSGTIQPGDVLLVDTADVAPVERAVYAVRLRGEVLVRCLVFAAGGLRLLGSAVRSPVIDVEDPEDAGFEVLGRVIVRIGGINQLF